MYIMTVKEKIMSAGPFGKGTKKSRQTKVTTLAARSRRRHLKIVSLHFLVQRYGFSL
jgi:hypothetical protein